MNTERLVTCRKRSYVQNLKDPGVAKQAHGPRFAGWTGKVRLEKKYLQIVRILLGREMTQRSDPAADEEVRWSHTGLTRPLWAWHLRLLDDGRR